MGKILGIIMFVPFVMALIGGAGVYLIWDLIFGNIGDSFKDVWRDYKEIWNGNSPNSKNKNKEMI